MTNNDFAPLRILLVDDDEMATDLHSFAFASKGYDVMVVPSCERGVEAVATFQPDIAFIDVELPDMQAMRIARALSAGPATRSTWLVALNARYIPPVTKLVSDAGFHFRFSVDASIDDLLMLAEAKNCLGRQSDS